MGTTRTDLVRAARLKARRPDSRPTPLQRALDDARARRVTQVRRAMTTGTDSRPSAR